MGQTREDCYNNKLGQTGQRTTCIIIIILKHVNCYHTSRQTRELVITFVWQLAIIPEVRVYMCRELQMLPRLYHTVISPQSWATSIMVWPRKSSGSGVKALRNLDLKSLSSSLEKQHTRHCNKTYNIIPDIVTELMICLTT